MAACTRCNGYSAVKFPELPGGLITQPTLVWELDSPVGGTQRARVTYQTGGITWWADYNAVYNEGGTPTAVRWISRRGSASSTSPARPIRTRTSSWSQAMSTGCNPPRGALATLPWQGGDGRDSTGFVEKPFDEFHLYTLGRTTTLPNNSTKQIELFQAARQVPARRLLIYDALGDQSFGEPYTERDPGFASNTKVATYLEFRNDAASGLGIPLAGRASEGLAHRQRGRERRVYWRGCDRPHPQGQHRKAEAGQCL